MNFKIKEGKIYVNGIQLSIENIEIKRIIGKGANGIVFYGIDEILDREVAVKVWVKKNKDNRNKLKQGLYEARKISALRHENIVTAYSAQIHSDVMLSLTTEYLNGGTLCDYLHLKPDLNTKIRIWKQIENAMAYAHSHGIYHGDLHAKNVMIISEKPIIIDFGTSVFSKTQRDSKKRECDLITKLAIEMFPEWDGAILSIEGVNGLPEMALNQCADWVSLFQHYDNFLRYLDQYTVEKGTHSLREELRYMGLAIIRSPSIERLGVLKMLQQNGLPEWIIEEFLCGCIDMAKLALMDGPYPSVSKSMALQKSIKQLFDELDEVAGQVMLRHLYLCKSDPAKYLSEVA